jgi:hypothetical protein
MNTEKLIWVTWNQRINYRQVKYLSEIRWTLTQIVSSSTTKIIQSPNIKMTRLKQVKSITKVKCLISTILSLNLNTESFHKSILIQMIPKILSFKWVKFHNKPKIKKKESNCLKYIQNLDKIIWF